MRTTTYRFLIFCLPIISTFAAEISLEKLGSIQAVPGAPSSVEVHGTNAFIAHGSGGLQIVDVSNPVNPSRIGGISLPGLANHVTVVDSFAYIANGTNGLV